MSLLVESPACDGCSIGGKEIMRLPMGEGYCRG